MSLPPRGSRSPFNGFGKALRRAFGTDEETREITEPGADEPTPPTAMEAAHRLREAADMQEKPQDTGPEKLSRAADHLKKLSRSVTSAASRQEAPGAPVPETFQAAMKRLMETMSGS
jgi:hypothetical protein